MRFGPGTHVIPSARTSRYLYPHVGIKKNLQNQWKSLQTQRKPQCELREYDLRWALLRWHRVGQVNFVLFVFCFLVRFLVRFFVSLFQSKFFILCPARTYN